MRELAPGEIFAGHRIEGVAGRGGFGVVYRATHLALDHIVALKVISGERAADETFRDRFKSESRIAVSIRHPSVVAVHHAGEEDGRLFVTMDFVEGTDLRGLLNREGRLQPARAVEIVSQVASALDAAHERGLVHRDIKPGNVLIEGGEAGNRVFLTDFGLSKRIDATSGVTATGAFVGTLDYVAPEQIKGERVDARTDVYALGCVLYELLTGEVPFAGEREKVAKMSPTCRRRRPSWATPPPRSRASSAMSSGAPSRKTPSAVTRRRAISPAPRRQPSRAGRPPSPSATSGPARRPRPRYSTLWRRRRPPRRPSRRPRRRRRAQGRPSRMRRPSLRPSPRRPQSPRPRSRLPVSRPGPSLRRRPQSARAGPRAG